MNQHTHPDAGRVELTIRPLGGRDATELRRLAQRDSAREPRGELLGAEMDGHLVAAVSTTTGEVVADPFRPTAEAVAELRQTANRANGHGGGVRSLWALLGHTVHGVRPQRAGG
jgi:hypothetical protein